MSPEDTSLSGISQHPTHVGQLRAEVGIWSEEVGRGGASAGLEGPDELVAFIPSAVGAEGEQVDLGASGPLWLVC